MGFSTIATGVVLFAGFLLYAQMMSNALFEAERSYNQALDDDRDRAEFHRHTNVTLLNGNHNAGHLHLNMSNTGGTVLDLGAATLLLDGVWSTSSIITKTVNGVSTDLWAPGQTLYLKATAASAPSRAYFVAETGAAVLWSP